MKSALVVYSGGLDTTVCLALMKERKCEKIHAVTVDLGQPQQDIEQARIRCQALQIESFILDKKQTFAYDYCSQAITFNADYYGYPLSTAIARPLIAQSIAEHYQMHGPFDSVVHGCTGKGNDQFRIEYGLRAHIPGVKILAPMREENWTRSAEIEYAKKHGVQIAQSKDQIWSIDENLWGRSIEGGHLEDPYYQPPEEIFAWTVASHAAPDEPQAIQIDFKNGVPVALNGQEISLLEMIVKCNEIAGMHGIGRIDIMEDRMIGLKVRENYECPAATLLIKAHAELESLVCAPHERRFKEFVDKQWADLVYQGLWWDPLFDDLVAFNTNIQRRVEGSVKLVLHKGSVRILGRKSPYALYSHSIASFDDETFDQKEMTGMVKSHGMSSLMYVKQKES